MYENITVVSSDLADSWDPPTPHNAMKWGFLFFFSFRLYGLVTEQVSLLKL